MKKLVSLLLCLMMLFVMGAAMAAEPGDEIVITVEITGVAEDGRGAGYVYFDANSAPVTNTKIAKKNQTDNDQITTPKAGALSGRIAVIGYMDNDTETTTVQTGVIAQLTFKINDDAKPGKYEIKLWGEGDITAVSGGTTFTIAGCIECKADEGTVTKKATCTEEGEKTFKCVECGKTMKTEKIEKIAHDFTKEVIATEATCTEAGVKNIVCSMCDKLDKTEAIPAPGHKAGEMTVIKEASCKETGLKQSACTVCGEVAKEEIIPVLAHKVGEAEVTKQPTCTEEGVATGSCTVCSEKLENSPIPALGHTKDEGVVTTEPTCAKEGVKTFKCTVCGEEMGTEAVPVVPHTEDKGTVTVEPTCTAEGEQVIKCTVCDAEIRTEKVPAKGHVPGEWVVVKPAENDEDGLKERYCTVCGELVDTAIIPGSIWYHMTVSSVGPRFRDVSDLTKNWNMFTVVDLTVEGEQQFYLIGGDMHIVGVMTVKVAEGKLTVTYELVNNEMMVKEEFLSIVTGLEAITSLEEMPAFAFGEEISIADQLAGDTTVLIYIKNVVHYESTARGLRDFCDNREYTDLVEAMMEKAN